MKLLEKQEELDRKEKWKIGRRMEERRNYKGRRLIKFKRPDEADQKIKNDGEIEARSPDEREKRNTIMYFRVGSWKWKATLRVANQIK